MLYIKTISYSIIAAIEMTFAFLPGISMYTYDFTKPSPDIHATSSDESAFSSEIASTCL